METDKIGLSNKIEKKIGSAQRGGEWRHETENIHVLTFNVSINTSINKMKLIKRNNAFKLERNET